MTYPPHSGAALVERITGRPVTPLTPEQLARIESTPAPEWAARRAMVAATLARLRAAGVAVPPPGPVVAALDSPRVETPSQPQPRQGPTGGGVAADRGPVETAGERAARERSEQRYEEAVRRLARRYGLPRGVPERRKVGKAEMADILAEIWADQPEPVA